MADFQNPTTDELLRSATALGLFCEEDKQGNWQIRAPGSSGRWYLQQDYQRWLLIIDGVSQISLHRAEVIAFIKRWSTSQQKP